MGGYDLVAQETDYFRTIIHQIKIYEVIHFDIPLFFFSKISVTKNIYRKLVLNRKPNTSPYSPFLSLEHSTNRGPRPGFSPHREMFALHRGSPSLLVIGLLSLRVTSQRSKVGADKASCNPQSWTQTGNCSCGVFKINMETKPNKQTGETEVRF